MGKYDSLLELLRRQKEGYAKLLRQAESMNEALSADAATDESLRLMRERDATLNEIRENDDDIAAILRDEESKGWTERKDAASLIEDIKELVKRVMALDEEGRAKLMKASGSVRKEFGDIASVKRGVSGYGQGAKKASPRYKDLKL